MDTQTRKQKLEVEIGKGARDERGRQKSDKRIPHPAKNAGFGMTRAEENRKWKLETRKGK
jgi:hypothetical protein